MTETMGNYNGETKRYRMLTLSYETWVERLHGKMTRKESLSQGTEQEGEYSQLEAVAKYAEPGSVLFQWVGGEWVYWYSVHPRQEDPRPGARHCLSLR